MSKTLRELRIEKGLTLGELAAALGCAVSGPGSWERGRYGPSPRQIPRLAVALGITPEDARKAAEESRRKAREACIEQPRCIEQPSGPLPTTGAA